MLNVLSLFDGMSCGRIALERAGLKVGKYYASEIDKFAIQISNKNWPDIIQLGDITKWKEWDIDFSEIDLILAGFPCQAWSVAGKQKGENDPRGALVYDLISVWNKIKECNPNVKFLFENVRMKKQFLDYISKELFNVEPVLINSALVSAQNRNRYYWTSVKSIPQPEDKGIILADIIEEGIVDRDKSYCLDANYFKGTNVEQYINKARRQIVFSDKCIQSGLATNIKGYDMRRRIYSINGKSPTLTAVCGGHQETKIATDTKHWRKLTPIECERLQTLPDNYTEGVSNTQRYKMIGNGWTVDVITHILRHMYKDPQIKINNKIFKNPCIV